MRTCERESLCSTNRQKRYEAKERSGSTDQEEGVGLSWFDTEGEVRTKVVDI